MPTNNKKSGNRAHFVVNNDFDLWILLDHARSALSRSRELELAQYGLTPEQAAVLHTLVTNGGSATNAQIADSMIRQYNSVTTLVNRMAKLDLVKKGKNNKDKRFHISITPKGQRLYSKLTRTSIKMTFAVLTKEEKQKLASYLTKLVRQSRSMLGMDRKLPFLL